MYPLRVFVSYLREQKDLASRLVTHLTEAGHEPLWDADISAGSPFSDEIKGRIAYSHLFVPLLTEKSNRSPWVLQEIGFATALEIPILPVLVSPLNQTEILIAPIQALHVDEELGNFREGIERLDMEHLVIPVAPRSTKMIDVCEWPEQRTTKLVEAAERELRMGNYGQIRQKGAYSTFYVPPNADKELWKALDGRIQRGSYYRQLLGDERRVLGQHADAAGCSLIIDPSIRAHFSGDPAILARLQSLRDFFEGADPKKVRVVTSSSARRQNLTIVGDWFFAESRIPSPEGYRHTLFNFHAPTVLKRVQEFDRELERKAAAIKDASNEALLSKAISEIDEVMEKLGV